MPSNLATTFNNLKSEGTLTVLGLATFASVVVSVLTLQGGANFSSTGSGLVLKVDNVVRYQEVSATCTATGGLTKYSACWQPAVLSSTGSIKEIGLECGNVPKQLTGDVTFKATRFSNTGTVLTNLDNIVAGTGSTEASRFATELTWAPTVGIAYTTLVTPTSADCKMYTVFSDKYGN
jgi:hypothetical protein